MLRGGRGELEGVAAEGRQWELASWQPRGHVVLISLAWSFSSCLGHLP